MQASSRGFRVDARFPLRLRVEIMRPGAGVPLTGTLIDLSFGGARLVVEGEVRVGETVACTVHGPLGSRPLLLRGRTVWARALLTGTARMAAGLRFDLEETEAEALFALLYRERG